MMPIGLVQDLRSGARLLARNPGFTLIAVLSLAVGIGANTATFSFADALLLRPLPVPQPNEVVTVGSMNVATGGTDLLRASYRDYVDLRDASASFAGGLVAFEDIAVQFLLLPRRHRRFGRRRSCRATSSVSWACSRRSGARFSRRKTRSRVGMQLTV